MSKTTSCRPALQSISRKTTRRFTAIPANTPEVWRSLRPAFYFLIQLCRYQAWCEITHADLAKAFGVHPATAARWIYALIEHGVIVRVQRRSSRCWSLPNRYRIPHLEGFFESVDKVSNSAHQNPRDLIKPNTNTTREVPRAKSYAQLKWEWNRSRHPHRYQDQPRVGRCRLRYLEAIRIATNASIGSYVGDNRSDEQKNRDRAELERLRAGGSIWGTR